MAERTVYGSGGHIVADLTEEQVKKADLGVGKLFVAPIGKLDKDKMSKYFCKNCNSEFGSSPTIRVEQSTKEEVADNLMLVERGQYTCKQCNAIIGEYRVFQKKDESEEVGKAKPIK